MGEAFVTRFDGPGPEGSIVKDMVKKAAIAAPVLIVAFGLIWGIDGALSTAYAIAIVVVNFALSAAILVVVGPHLARHADGRHAVRLPHPLGHLLVAVLPRPRRSWVELVPLGITLVVTHLGLLFWEMRYVSASLAFPGLKPELGSARRPPTALPDATRSRRPRDRHAARRTRVPADREHRRVAERVRHASPGTASTRSP